MTVLWTVRAAEPTAAFSPQRKCKTVQFKSSPRNHEKSNCKEQLLFQLYSPYGEWYCCAVIFGFLPSDIRFASVRANIISL